MRILLAYLIKEIPVFTGMALRLTRRFKAILTFWALERFSFSEFGAKGITRLKGE
ncbi:MAG: hypothetical protein MK086_14295 [Flavobacteriales bacterium]|nr:hypothetical protein [Flavobacteriales bacterium]MCH2216333.1 hypothetical protein [Flavobacteriales bacterium]